ncbi:MAG: tyrosine-protein phosphatase [Bacteroides sp.]
MNEHQHTRLLPIQGAYNVRDLGGYTTKNHRRVKWGKVFRSGDLNQLTEQDISLLNQIGLKTYIDFRSKKERSVAIDKEADSVEQSIWMPIDAGDMSDMANFDLKRVPTIMPEVYEIIIKHSQDVYKELFRILQADSFTPLLFHCSAGKDRTGIAAALFLSSLNVEREIIMEDYLLSAEYLKGKYDYFTTLYPALAPLSTVDSTYLQAAFDVIDSEFGGVNQYLTYNLGVDIEKMKDLYTE